MNKIASFLVAAGILIFTAPAFAVSNIDNGAGGTTTSVGAADTVTITATAGTSVSNNLSVGGTTTTNGINNSGQTITGVAAGAAATDAVNVGQLTAATTAAAASTSGQFKDLEGGVANAVAMGSIPQVDPGKKFSLGIGFGAYEGETAGAAGASFRVNDSAVVKASVGFDSNSVAVGVGGAYSW